MNANQLLIFAGIAQVVLTFIVWVVLFYRRVGELKRRKINPQKIATSSQSAAIMEDVRASDNFKHLFEMPVLFYFLCTLAVATQATSFALAALAWMYVVLRYLHSYIQCGKNKVMPRFYVFVASSLTLLAMWVVFAVAQISVL
jgi:hypothetical protein